MRDVAGRDMGMNVEGWVNHKMKTRMSLHASVLEMCMVRAGGINLKGKTYILYLFGEIILYFQYLLSMSDMKLPRYS